MAVGNAVRRSGTLCGDKKVFVVSDDDALLSQGKCEMLHITGTNQANIAGERDIDAAPAEPVGNGWIDVFVEVESDAVGHA